MAFPWLARHPLVLYRFRFLDPLSGKWTRARYVATLEEIAARYVRWQIIGLAEVRDPVVGSFSPHSASDAAAAPPDTGVQFVVPAELDATESFLTRVFLRRYVQWAARRRRRFAEMEGAAALLRSLTSTR